LLSDHVFHLFGRTVTLTSSEQLMAIVVLVIAATAWTILQFRRRRSVAVQRSAVTDQMLYELSRIADALDRIASRPVEAIPAPNFREFKEEKFREYKEDEPRKMPFSMFGRER